MHMNTISIPRYLRELATDPKRNMPLAIAAGAVKGALVGLAVGKLALATAAGMAGGAAVGAALSWRRQQREKAAGGRAWHQAREDEKL